MDEEEAEGVNDEMMDTDSSNGIAFKDTEDRCSNEERVHRK